MMTVLGTAEIAESHEFQDVTMRIFSVRGSIPIQIVSNGIVATNDEIGARIKEAFEYFLVSEIFDATQVM